MALLFVTSSQDKLAEVQRILGRTVVMADKELAEPQAVELEVVVAAKVQEAHDLLQAPLIVEDSGLFIAAWNGLPGALVKWFLQYVGVEGICAMLGPFSEREAVARTLVGYHNGQVKTFDGSVRGHIAETPRGEGGFGFDSIFIPEGSSRTFAEMEPDEKDFFSMRQRALKRLASDAEALRGLAR
jgi:non-canonical purine NTP pyrophosphatase (RdgB/HAM1 family)